MDNREPEEDISFDGMEDDESLMSFSAAATAPATDSPIYRSTAEIKVTNSGTYLTLGRFPAFHTPQTATFKSLLMYIPPPPLVAG